MDKKTEICEIKIVGENGTEVTFIGKQAQKMVNQDEIEKLSILFNTTEEENIKKDYHKNGK